MNIFRRHARIRSTVAAGLGSALLASTALAVAVGVAGSAAAAGSPPWEPVANPPEVGGLIFYNSAGQQITGGSTTASPLAAYVQGTTPVQAGDTTATLFARTPVNGVAPGQWGGEELSGSTSYPNVSAPAALASSGLPLVTGAATDEDLAVYQEDFPNNDTSSDGYAGIFVLRLVTSAPGQGLTTSYDSADIQITGTTWSVVYPTPTLKATTTKLVATPASPQLSGTAVHLTATVSPTAPGKVQFKNGTTNIGAAVTVAAGKASISTSTLPVGVNALHAVFTPTKFTAYKGSTGTLSYTIKAISVTTKSLPGGTHQVAYKTTLKAAGGTAPYHWILTGGTKLPPGLKLSGAGVISGTPTTAGTYSFQVRVTDSSSPANTTTATFTLVIS